MPRADERLRVLAAAGLGQREILEVSRVDLLLLAAVPIVQLGQRPGARVGGPTHLGIEQRWSHVRQQRVLGAAAASRRRGAGTRHREADKQLQQQLQQQPQHRRSDSQQLGAA